MSVIRNARERARDEITREIKEEARRQLAAEGAARLSLRAVARALGMVSSAVYRYFPSREDLLTALIIDAYNALGAEAERAYDASSGGDAMTRWVTVCRSVRTWAVAHPHEYALLYGSPVPGYQAPRETVAPASRVALVFVALLREAHGAGVLQARPEASEPPSGLLTQPAPAAAELFADLPAAVFPRMIVAWTQLFGMISFELFGHLVGSVDDYPGFFDHAATSMARYVGLLPAA